MKTALTILSTIGCLTGLLWVYASVTGGVSVLYVSLPMLIVTGLAIAATARFAKAGRRRQYAIAAALYALPVVASFIWLYFTCQPLSLFGEPSKVLMWPPTTITVLVSVPLIAFVAGLAASVVGAVRDGMAAKRLPKKW